MVDEPQIPNPDPTPEGTPSPPPNWKDRVRNATQNGLTRINKSQWAKGLIGRIQTTDPAAIAEWLNHRLQKQGFAFWGKLATLVLSTYFLADISGILVSKYLPKPPPVRTSRSAMMSKKYRSLDDYNPIFARNLFNSRGIIPGEETPHAGPQDQGGPAILTTLPFNLLGTLILRDEIRSIATIEDKSAAAVYPVRVQDEIPSKARIIQIEPRRVTFINMSSGRREYVELPEEPSSSAPRITLGTQKSGGGIEQVAPSQFNVSRTEVDKALSNMNEILTQARAVPNFENGVPAGYKLFQIVPGSIYAKLGLQNGDVIAGVDGEPINDPGRAFELLGRLKTASRLEIQVKRNGKTMNNAYEIR